jgi:hypothetical protein
MILHDFLTRTANEITSIAEPIFDLKAGDLLGIP